MKENITKCLVALLFAISIIGCTEKNNEETKITQRIMGAGDCIVCSGWSWSNGEAKTTRDEGAECIFRFKTIVSGELSFSHKSKYSSSSYDWLTVMIGNKMYFNEKESHNTFSKSSIGSVNAGDTISFTGREFYVKDIKIIGVANNPDKSNTPDTPSNPDNPWDF